MKEQEQLIELENELMNFLRRLRQRQLELNKDDSSWLYSSIRGELKHRAVIIKNLMSQYRRGTYDY